MKYIVPDYYSKFKCIADKCTHNCCIGWEIDIDEFTYDYYISCIDDFGKKLKEGINHKTCSFKTDCQGRCVFLNQKGLCDIIINMGENSLCDICNDHPRFRNFYSDREEMGLGLCCEEACRLILSRNKTEFISTEDDCPEEPLTEEEKAFLINRDKIFKQIQNNNVPYLRKAELPGMTLGEIVKFYRQMERLSREWDVYLDKLKKPNEKYRLPENIVRQLGVYFLYRHGDEKFASHGVGFIETLCGSLGENPAFDEICEVCRMYSCEVEYSDINIESILHCIRQ